MPGSPPSRLHDVDAERACIGAVFINPAAIRDGLAGLRACDFSEPSHKIVWAALQGLAERGEPIDIVSLASALRDAGRLEEVGGLAYLGTLARAVPSSANAGHYAEAVRRAAYRRHMAEAGRLLLAASEADDPAGAAGPVLEALREEVPAPTVPGVTAEELLANPPPERGDVVAGGVVVRGGMTLLIGLPKTGKSMLALNLAAAVAGGTPFLEWATTPGRVVYLAGEGGPRLLRDRLRAMRLPAETLRNLLFVWPNEGASLRLDHPAARAGVVKRILDFKADLVIVDPLVRFHGKNENDTGEMAALTRDLAEFRRRTGAALVIVHHSRKPGLGFSNSAIEARGSSVVFAESDAAMTLARRPGGQEHVLGLELRWTAEPLPLVLKFDPETLGFEAVGNVQPRGQKLTEEGLLDLLREVGPSTAEKLAEAAGVTKRTVLAYLSALERKHAVAATTGARGLKTWRIAGEEPPNGFDL